MKHIVVEAEQIAELRFAKAQSFLKNELEDLPKLARARTDDCKQVRCCFLLLECFIQFSGEPSGFVFLSS
jgi:hypothetical protein